MRRPTLAFRHPRVTARSAVSASARVEPGGPLVLLYSDDLEATVAAVKDAGGRIADEPYAFPGGRRLNLLRPEREQARRMEHNLGNMRFMRSDQGEC
jgi:hypothetical protein